MADDRGVLNRYEYDVWGNLAVCEETVPNRFLYTGQQCDPLTRQYYLRARYYNPVMARFTQEDTYRGDGLNLYAYCRNNPVCHVDPSGHCSKDPNSAFMPPAVVPEGKQLPAIYVPQQEALLRWYANFQDDTGTAHTGNGSSGEFMPPAVIPKQPLPSLDSLQPPLMPEPPRQLPAVIYPLPQNLLDGNPQNRVSGASADVPDSGNRVSVGEETITLYHGTSTEGADSIYNNGVDLNHATRNMDFGKGFYTTTDIEQARQWAARHGTDGGAIVEFNIPRSEFNGLNNKVFDSAGAEWGDFVVNSRRGMINNYDTVSGPMLMNPQKALKGAPIKSKGQQTAFNTQKAVDLLNKYICN